jgi:hypothetical protein
VDVGWVGDEFVVHWYIACRAGPLVDASPLDVDLRIEHIAFGS